jgi:L-ascorbate metabolism protein UlaG (beta-lactamase superfamily)
MRKLLIISVLVLYSINVLGQKIYERDTIPTSNGNLIITFIGHSSLQFTYLDKNIYIDPVGQIADFSMFPKADAILITHEHGDHLDPAAIGKLQKPGTEVYLTALCQPKYPAGKICKNDSFIIAAGVPVEVVPAYNVISRRGNGLPYHPKGDGNGYILTFGQTRVYVAGDTEFTTDMAKIKNVNIAFLPVAEPYTMPVYMAVEAVKTLKPQIFYPYHLNNTVPDQIKAALMGTLIEVRIRSLK